MKQRFFVATLFTYLLTALLAPARPAFAAALSASTAAELIAAINTANANPDEDLILLTSDITLTASVETNEYGSTGLPSITTPIIIEGQGHWLERDRLVTAPNFRIFRVTVGASLTLTNLSLGYGKATNGSLCSTLACGGNIYNAGILTINHSVIYFGSAYWGAGVFNSDNSTFNMTNSTISSNTSSNNGGGVYNGIAANLSIMNAFFIQNKASQGGGVFNNQGNLTITDSTFSGNIAFNNGGAVSGKANILGSTFSGNSAVVGGALFNGFQSMDVTNSSFSTNIASNSGGGLYAGGNNNTINITRSTFSDNSATASGGGVYNIGANTMTIRDTIINDSTGGNCVNGGSGATINGDGFSLADDNSCLGFINSPAISLTNLGSFGGPTQTFALIPDPLSIAIDSGSALCSGLDQRGITRGYNGTGAINSPKPGDCDVGAFEYSSNIQILQFASASSSLPFNYLNTFPVTLALDNPLTQAGTVTAYVWVSGGTAVAGVDYEPFGMQSVSITPGQTSAVVNLHLLSSTSTTNRTIILSFATQRGTGFDGAVRLGAQQTHTVTLKASLPGAAPSQNLFTTHTPALTWNAASGATGYEIQIDTDKSFLAPYPTAPVTVSDSTFTLQLPSLPNGVYYWRVRAVGGNWSPIQTFEILAP